jgi:hypothetical protein
MAGKLAYKLLIQLPGQYVKPAMNIFDRLKVTTIDQLSDLEEEQLYKAAESAGYLPELAVDLIHSIREELLVHFDLRFAEKPSAEKRSPCCSCKDDISSKERKMPRATGAPGLGPGDTRRTHHG